MKLRKGMLLGALLAAGLLLVACAGPAAQGPTLADSQWSLQSLNEEPVIPGSEITIEFAGGRVSGSAGCNSYQGDYQQSDNQLTIPELAATEVFCEQPEGVMDQETRYLDILRRTSSFEIEGDTLTLTTGQGERLVFTRQQ